MCVDSEIPLPATALFPREQGPEGAVLLRIIATSDLHTQLLSYDYFSNRQLPGSGLAQIACLIEEARRGVAGAVLLDNGDFLQGGALAEIGAAKRNRRPHPAISAFNALGYDAVALGNHEFDYGLETLSRAIADARFPVLSANVLRQQGITPLADRHFSVPATLIRREIRLPDGGTRPLTIGIFGLTPPETLQWNSRWVKDQLLFRQMQETARAWAPELRRQGADIVICLAHTGIAQPYSSASREAEADLIAAVPGLDAVIAGHSHLIFPDPRDSGASGHIAGIPVVQPGHEGSHLGIIDLWLRPEEERWQVVRSRSRALPGQEAVAGMHARAIRDASAPLRLALAKDHSAALFRMRQRLGTLTVPLSTWFANVSDGQAMRLVGTALAHHAQARLAHGPLGTVPVVALVSPFRSGGRGGPMNYADIPPGPISLRHVFSLYPFPNTLTALLTTAGELAARLDRASALFHRIVPGCADQMLTDPGIPSFSFTSAIGATYRIDLAAPVTPPGIPHRFDTGRIRDLRIAGRALAPEDPLILVLNNYVTDDPARSAGRLVLDEGRLCTDVIADYIREVKHITEDHSRGWRFEPMPGTSVLYDSGSGAGMRLDSVAGLRPEPLGLMPSGFSRFRLHL